MTHHTDHTTHTTRITHHTTGLLQRAGGNGCGGPACSEKRGAGRADHKGRLKDIVQDWGDNLWLCHGGTCRRQHQREDGKFARDQSGGRTEETILRNVWEYTSDWTRGKGCVWGGGLLILGSSRYLGILGYLDKGVGHWEIQKYSLDNPLSGGTRQLSTAAVNCSGNKRIYRPAAIGIAR